MYEGRNAALRQLILQTNQALAACYRTGSLNLSIAQAIEGNAGKIVLTLNDNNDGEVDILMASVRNIWLARYACS